MNDFPLVTADEMAEVDRLAVENGLEIAQMMEYAGLNIARHVQGFEGRRVLILCGKGHNGGDGLAAARHLENWGYEPLVLLAEPARALKEAAQHHFEMLVRMGVEVELGDVSQRRLFQETDVIVDALLGYNVDGDPRDNYAELIDLANESGKPILAIDLPSGLDAVTGEALNPCIRADETLTLALPKTVLLEKSATEYVGDVFVADLGIPQIVYEQAGISVPAGLFTQNSIERISSS